MSGSTQPPVLARRPAAPGSNPRTVPLVAGALALDPVASVAPVVPGQPPGPALAAVPDRPVEEPPDEELQTWARRFAQAVVEVTGGDRPLVQLLRWTSVAVYADLDRRVRMLAAARSVPGRHRVRPLVRSVRVFQPTPLCAEVAVHVRYGPRSRALAARLENREGRWTCTQLQLG